MDFEKSSILSFYEELTTLDEEKNVFLVKHVDSGDILVKKIKEIYNLSVYERLKKSDLPGVPKIHECFEADGKLYIIEDYVHGKNLQDLRERRGGFTEKEVIDIGIQVCDILIDFEEMTPSIIHRDIKPSNLIITYDNRIRLIDFNAAKEFKYNKSQDTVLMGTHHYAAPEQYGFGYSDPRTDIFALGATINYLLTGCTVKEYIYDGKLGDIIKKCININPTERFQSAEELKNELRCILQPNLKKKRKALYTANPYYLPGFRTGNIKKMILACVGYLSFFYYSYDTVFSENGKMLTGAKLKYEQTAFFLIFLGIIFLLCDYLDIKKRLPGYGESFIKNRCFDVIYILLYTFVLLIIVFMTEPFIF